MNKEKLINSILRDIDELREITEEIKNDRFASILEVNLAFSKAGLLLQEFQLLKEKYIGGNQQNVVEKEIVAPISFVAAVVEETETKAVVEETPKPDETTEPVADVPEMQHEPLLVLDEDASFETGEPEDEELEEPEEVEEDFIEEEENLIEEEENLVEEEEDLVEGEEDLDEEEENLVEGEEEPNEGEVEEEAPIYVKEIPDYEEEFEVKEEQDEEEPEAELDEDAEFEEEPDPSLAENQTIGEKFHAEKSVNDIMGNQQENGTLDQKFAHGPISSLQAAIGINDRFLFIREIFNNDAQLYSSAIKRLDSCNDIREAVDYLSNNFRIKKTETSLKFVELIKRRFAK
ncbi:MAG: hypothetical protein RBS73_10440 [Prolixibacteraceae bacterium]|jgi:hypothetical protein|nr:hypothetical protein [Prolixibacteraceae bacterium]